jgi:hypothetical protein
LNGYIDHLLATAAAAPPAKAKGEKKAKAPKEVAAAQPTKKEAEKQKEVTSL